MISIRRQLEALLKVKTDDHVRRHTYTWPTIDPKHRLGGRLKKRAINLLFPRTGGGHPR